jgi:hypothetical protein
MVNWCVRDAKAAAFDLFSDRSAEKVTCGWDSAGAFPTLLPIEEKNGRSSR